MRLSDRALGLVILLSALAYGAGATQIQTSFLSDPVGPKTFPLALAGILVICGGLIMLRPDPDPDWPGPPTLGAIGFATLVLIGYAYSLKPLGFLIPTTVAAAILSFQLSPRPLPAVLTGIGLAVGLYLLFRYGLGLETLRAVPKDWLG